MKKIVVITGTRKGIGKSIADHFLSKGYIVAGCSRNEGSIQNSNYYHYILDISDEKDVVSMIRDIVKRWKQIDILINNAGVAAMNHVLLTPLKSSQSIFNTNFFGTFIFIREVSKIMLKRNIGRIVNFTTIATPLKLEGEAIYAASKAAVENLTKVAAKELGQFGITVNAIGPTPVLTDLIRTVPKEKIQSLINNQTIKRYGEYKDILNVIDFFTDEKSDFITGQVIYLGGINN